MTKHTISSRIARLGKYAARRIADLFTGLPGRQALREACRSMGDAIRPKRPERDDPAQGCRGRHADGGRTRFRAVAEESCFDEAALKRLAASRRRNALAFCIAAAAAQISGSALPFLAQDLARALAGLALGPFLFAMLVTAVRADFASWQIEQRRFGDFAEYVAMRWTDGRVAQSPELACEGDGDGLGEPGAATETAAAASEMAESAIAEGTAPSCRRCRRQGRRQRRRQHRRRRRHQRRRQRRRASERSGDSGRVTAIG